MTELKGFWGGVRIWWHCLWRTFSGHRMARIGGVFGPAFHYCSACDYGRTAFVNRVLALIEGASREPQTEQEKSDD